MFLLAKMQGFSEESEVLAAGQEFYGETRVDSYGGWKEKKMKNRIQ